MVTARRPEAWQSRLRHVSQAGQSRLPNTHGWYMRGRNLPGGMWEPEYGLPTDVLVYLDMGDTYVREAYPAEGFLPLSEVTNPKAIANLHPEFAVTPPDFDRLDQAMSALRARRPDAIAATEEQIAFEEQKIKDGDLPKGEGPQLRKVVRQLKKRLVMLKDDAQFETQPIYEAMVRERQAVIRSQMDPKALQVAELQRELSGWDENLATLAGARAGGQMPDSTSESATRPRSTRRPVASGEPSTSS